MPTVFGYHDVKDRDHWLASSKREEFFGPLRVTDIRTSSTQPTRAVWSCSLTSPTWTWSRPPWRPRQLPRRWPTTV